MDIAAVYFPSWHANPHYSAWYGQGFSEWELLKTTKPLFPGHHQPKVPCWGYFDESAPVWAAREIDLAADAGITAFLFDWYWYSGVRLMEEALERGFLQADNCDRLKFAIMWANHDWGTWPAVTGVPGMSRDTGVNRGQQVWLPARHWREDLDNVIDYCCEHYFCRQNYWTVAGRPRFFLWDIRKFAADLGGVKAAAEALQQMTERARQNGFAGIHFTGNIGCCNDNLYCCGYDRVPETVEMGFESVFAYNIVRTPAYSSLPQDRPLVPYDDVMQSHAYCWDRIEKWGALHCPVVTFGCDVTPRWHRGVELPYDFRELGYEPIVIDNTPDKFGQLCRQAMQRAARDNEASAVIINAWNEWSEGMYLIPEKKYGDDYLQELHKAAEPFRKL